MTCPADLAAQQLAVGENRSTDAGAQREQDDVLRAPGGAEPCLAKQSSLCVVDDRYLEGGAKEFLPVEPLETGESLGHDSDRSAIRCRKSWGSNAHPLQCTVDVRNERTKGPQDVFAPRRVGRGCDSAPDHAALRRHGQHLGRSPAEI